MIFKLMEPQKLVDFKCPSCCSENDHQKYMKHFIDEVDLCVTLKDKSSFITSTYLLFLPVYNGLI